MEENANELYLEGINYLYGKDGYPLNRRKAFELIQKAAALGESEAMNQIGIMYKNGDVVTQNYETAILWFQKALQANPNNPYATYNMGQSYYTGQGVKKDTAKGFNYLERSIALCKDRSISCYPSACLLIGDILLIEQNKKSESYPYYLEAAKHGNFAVAWHNLGFLTENGIVPQNSPEAYSKDKRNALASTYYEEAAKLGYADSMMALVNIYLRYGMRDKVNYWLEKALCAGHPKAPKVKKLISLGNWNIRGIFE